MFKLYCFLETGVGTDPFAVHGAAAAALVRATCPNVTGYVQSRALPEQIGDSAPSYAGSAELYFDNAEALLSAWRNPSTLSPLWEATGATLSATLPGMVRCVLRTALHHSLPAVKAVFPFHRRSGMSVADFQSHWWHQHGPIAAATENALFYPQCHPLAACYSQDNAPDFDGVTELHWRDVATAQAAMASQQMRVDQSTDAKRFTAPDVGLYLAAEELVIAP